MKLDQIADEPNKRIYTISGEVGDPSGGESKKDRNISIKYIIEETRLIQEKHKTIEYLYPGQNLLC